MAWVVGGGGGATFMVMKQNLCDSDCSWGAFRYAFAAVLMSMLLVLHWQWLWLFWAGVGEGDGGCLRVTTYSPIILLDSRLCSWVAFAPSLGLVSNSADGVCKTQVDRLTGRALTG